MQNKLLLLVLLLSAVPNAFAENKVTTIPDSKNRIIKYTESGILPQNLKMSSDDSIVFFLNDTKNDLLSVELDYHGKRAHCASQNLAISEDGIARSVQPFAPHDFATACFHDAGSYSVTVFGMKNHPQGITSTITVE